MLKAEYVIQRHYRNVQMKLAILIPTLESRVQLRYRVGDLLMKQVSQLGVRDDVKILWNSDNGEKSTGEKSNELMAEAVRLGAEYVARFDDDDVPGPTYIQRGLEVVESGMDCGELYGQIYFDGVPGNPFHHSLIHDHWFHDDKGYYRYPNHLSFMKLSLIKDIPYPDITKGEDHQFSTRVYDAEVLKTEYKIPEIIYHYFVGKKDRKQEAEIIKQIYGQGN